MNKFNGFESTWRAALVLALLAAVLAGCGIKSTPKFPEKSTYPRHYPEQLPPLQVKPEVERQRSDGPGTPPAPSGIYQYPNPQGYKPPTE